MQCLMQFSIPWVPGPKQSARFRGFKGRRVYPDPKVLRDANSIAGLLAPYKPMTPFPGPLALEIEITYPWRKGEKKRWLARGWRPKDSRPDCDQLAKQMLDVMERMGFFLNDAQVATLMVRKGWGDGGPQTRICIEDAVAITAAEAL